VIGPHHAAVTHVGDSSEVGQPEHMVRQWAIKVSGEIIPSYRKPQRSYRQPRCDVQPSYITHRLPAVIPFWAPATGPLAAVAPALALLLRAAGTKH
jgi:hypothetical protein